VGFVLLGAMTVMVFRGIGASSGRGAGDGLVRRETSVQPDALLRDLPRKAERMLRANGQLLEGEVITSIGRVEGVIRVRGSDGAVREVTKAQWPEGLRITNAEMLGINLLREHPGTIEIAGVILLMAMLGAVVLSRKQVQMDEDAKASHLTALAKARASRDPVIDSPLELVNPVGAGVVGAQGAVSEDRA
jgi:hypothetical protein